MRFRLHALALAIAAITTFTSNAAVAAVMVATWSTKIHQVRQPDLLVPGPELEGTPFHMQLTYDTDLGDIHEIEKDGEHYSFVLGGLLKATVSFGDDLFDLDLANLSYSEQKYGLGDTGPYGYSSLNAPMSGGGFVIWTFLTSHADRASHDLTEPFSTQVEGEGVFIFVTPEREYQLDLRSTDGKPGWLTVERQTAAVPEPGTWALMIAGFGLAGAALRRRRAAKPSRRLSGGADHRQGCGSRRQPRPDRHLVLFWDVSPLLDNFRSAIKRLRPSRAPLVASRLAGDATDAALHLVLNTQIRNSIMRLRSLALAALLAATATSANAAIMVATWTTTISRVGAPPKFAPGPDLVGTPFQVSLTYDTSIGHSTGSDGDRTFNTIQTARGVQPLLGASVTYGSEHIVFDETALTLTQGLDSRFPSFAHLNLFKRHAVSDAEDLTIILDLSAFAGEGVIPLALDKAFDTPFVGNGSLTFISSDVRFPTSSAVEISLASKDNNFGRLTVVELQPSMPVPEPTTWALMIAGFGLTGVALRSRRSQVPT